MTGEHGDTTGDEDSRNAARDGTATRRARITTSHADAATAERVAAALRPDNTAEMTTRTDDERVVTTVARETTGGLQSTVDDYVVNCSVAAQLTTDDAPDATGADAGRLAGTPDDAAGSDSGGNADGDRHDTQL